MIEENEHYRRICSGVDFFAMRMERTYNFFVQTTIATIGGFMWLKLQSGADLLTGVLSFTRWIVPILAAVAVVQLWSDSVSWFGYRREEASFLIGPT